MTLQHALRTARHAWAGLPPRNRAFALAALAYVALLLGSAAPMRVVLSGSRLVLGGVFAPLLNAALLLALAAWLWRCRTALWPPGTGRVACLGAVALGYAVAVWALPVPEERFHLLQYGLLAWLLSEALDGLPALAGPRRDGVAVLLVTLVGAADEGVQWLLPNRVGDWRDVLINAAAAVLAQGLLACTLPRTAPASLAAENSPCDPSC